MTPIEQTIGLIGLGLCGLSVAMILADFIVGPLLERYSRWRRGRATLKRAPDLTSEYLETVDRR